MDWGKTRNRSSDTYRQIVKNIVTCGHAWRASAHKFCVWVGRWVVVPARELCYSTLRCTTKYITTSSYTTLNNTMPYHTTMFYSTRHPKTSWKKCGLKHYYYHRLPLCQKRVTAKLSPAPWRSRFCCECSQAEPTVLLNSETVSAIFAWSCGVTLY